MRLTHPLNSFQAEDAFLRPRLNARYRFSKRTLAGTQGDGRDAPLAVVRGAEIERQGSVRVSDAGQA